MWRARWNSSCCFLKSLQPQNYIRVALSTSYESIRGKVKIKLYLDGNSWQHGQMRIYCCTRSTLHGTAHKKYTLNYLIKQARHFANLAWFAKLTKLISNLANHAKKMLEPEQNIYQDLKSTQKVFRLNIQTGFLNLLVGMCYLWLNFVSMTQRRWTIKKLAK